MGKPGDLARLLREYPDHSITQYAIVLDKGNLPSVDDPRTGFTLGLRTVYLRKSKPAPCSSTPVSAVSPYLLRVTR